MLHYFCSLVCHQLTEKTLSCQGHWMYLCARCAGIYSGLLFGFAYQAIIGKNRSDLPRLNILLAIFGFILLSIFHIAFGATFPFLNNNRLRLFTGLFCGGSISLLFFPIFNYFIRTKSVNKPVIENGQSFTLFLLLLALLFALHFNPHPLIFYFLNYASIAGLIITYLALNLFLAALIINWKERKKNFRSALLLGLTALLFLSTEILLLRHNPLKIIGIISFPGIIRR